MPLEDKIKTIATVIYGAAAVEYSDLARERIRVFSQRGLDGLAVCMAKTALSLSADPELKGRPEGFVLPVRDVRAYCGAGFIAPLCGTIQTIPGLPHHPRGESIDIDRKGTIVGLQ